MTTQNSKVGSYENAPEVLVDSQSNETIANNTEADVSPAQSSDHPPMESELSGISPEVTDIPAPQQTAAGNLIVLAQQQGVEKFAHDINAKLDDMESQFEHLANAFGNGQLMLQSQLDKLGTQQHGLTEDISSLQAHLASTVDAQQQHYLDQLEAKQEQSDFNDHQRQINQEIQNRIKENSIEFSNNLAKVNDQIQEQQNYLFKLEANHEEVVKLHHALSDRHHHLDARAEKTSDSLAKLAETTQKQIQINRTHIEGLNALHRDQARSLQALSEEFDQLTVKTNSLADQLAELQIDSAEHKRSTRKNFRLVAGAIGVSTLALAGAMTYLHLQPSSMTDALNQRIDALSAVFSETSTTQNEQQQVIDTQLSALQTRFGNLEDQASERRTSIERLSAQLAMADASDADLNQQIATTTGELKVMLDQLHSLQNQIAEIENRIKPPATAFIATNEPLLPLNGNDWVDSQPPGNYSIQLIGVYQFPSIVTFVNQHRGNLNGADLSYNRSLYLGRDWYNLYYGSFSSFSDAQKALSTLPPDIQRNGPWIRSFKSIQENAQR